MRFRIRRSTAQPAFAVRAYSGGGPTETVVTGHVSGTFEWPQGDVIFDRAHLTGVSLRGPRTVRVTIGGSTFRDCDFSGLVFTSSFFGTRKHSHFEDCSFVGASFSDSIPGDVRFVRCDFSGARLDSWGPDDLEFIDCVFAGTIHNVAFTAMARRDHTEPPRSNNAFVGNDLRRCDLHYVAFHGGIDLDAQRLPEGDAYSIIDRYPERLAAARRWLAEQPPSRQRGGALKGLELVAIGAATQQRYWFRCDEWPDMVLEALGVPKPVPGGESAGG